MGAHLEWELGDAYAELVVPKEATLLALEQEVDPVVLVELGLVLKHPRQDKSNN